MSDPATMSESQRGRNMAWCMIGMCLWNLIVAIDSTALSVALPTISHDVRANTTQAFWCGTSFVLCSAACQPVIASFSNAFGRRSLLLLSLIFFTVGAIVCGVAHHVSVLILGRSIQGCGGGGLLTLTYVVMADEFTISERHKAISAISITWLIGTVVGPILSGGFTQHASWRWVFWINLPFCVICILIVAFFMKSTYKPSNSRMHGLRHIDWIGSTLFVGALTSFLVAISWGGTMFTWSSWHTVVPLAVGLAGVVAWIGYSVWCTDEPMIPLRIMNNRTASISYLGNLIQGLAQFGMLFYLPIYYQAVLGYSPTVSGVALLPQCLVAGLFSAITGTLASRYNTIRPFVLAGWVTYTLGLGLLTLLKANTTIPQWIFLNIPSGIGLGCLFSSLALASQAAAETSGAHSLADIIKIKTMAAALNPFFRTLGQAFGIVISQAVFTNQIKKRLGASVALDATSLGQEIQLLPAGSQDRIDLVNSFDDSLRVVWWLLFALSAAMLAITFFTKNMTLKPKTAATGKDLTTRNSNLSLGPKSSGSRTPPPVGTRGNSVVDPTASTESIEMTDSTDISKKLTILPVVQSLDDLECGFMVPSRSPSPRHNQK